MLWQWPELFVNRFKGNVLYLCNNTVITTGALGTALYEHVVITALLHRYNLKSYHVKRVPIL